MALHRPSEGELNLIQGTDDLGKTTDSFSIEILSDQEPGCDGDIVLDCCRCHHLDHQRLRLPECNAPGSHIGLKSSETAVEILRKPFCQIQPMGQQNLGTVRAQNLSVSDIFKWHRKPLLVAPEGNRFLSSPRPYCGSLRLQHRHRVGTGE